MKKIYAFCTALLVLSFSTLFAQTNRKVSGTVTDTSKTQIVGANVWLLIGSDTLRTTTDNEGYFSFSKIKAENFHLQVNTQGYKDFKGDFGFHNNKHLNLAPIRLELDGKMLKEVVIKAKPNPVRFMQDTIEYNADAFTILEGDNVAELLKKLPGMEVDEDNNVKTMGKEMVKLRVNGKDFFTNNVKDFIGRLPAGIVSKIQIIDDFGDEANFTGIKIGEPAKMLNIVTKPGMNKGKFGTLSSSAGTNNLFGINGIGNLWNDNKQGGISASLNTLNNGAGNTRNLGGSMNYRDKLGKYSSGGIAYNFSQNQMASTNERFIETVNPLGNFINNSVSRTENSNNGHNLNGSFGYNNKKIFLNGSLGASYGNGGNSNSSFNGQSGVIRQDLRNNSQSSNTSPRVNAGISFSKILKNRRNSFSANLNFNTSENNGEQNIITNTIYFDKTNGTVLKDSLLNRSLTTRGRNSGLGFGFNYSLGLKKLKDSLANQSFNLSYNLNLNNSENIQSTFVSDNITNQLSFVDSLSSNTTTVSVSQSIGLNYNYSKRNMRYNFGLNARPNFLTSNYIHENRKIVNNTFNYSPNLNFSKTLSKTKTINLNYSGNNTNPTIYQLQPLRNTQNLQNVVVGNPNLKSSFSHNLNTSFNYSAAKSGISIQTGINFSTVQREIVNNVVLIPDTLNSLKQITRFENINGTFNVGNNYYLSVPLVKNKVTINYSGTVGLSRRAVFINNEKLFNSGVNLSQRIGGNVSVKKFSLNLNVSYSLTNNSTNQLYNGFSDFQYMGLGQVSGATFFRSNAYRADMSSAFSTKKLNLRFGANFNTVHNNNTGLSNFNDVRSFDFNFSGRITIKKSYYFNFNSTKRINSGYSFANSNPLLVNAGLSKNFFKDQALSLNVNASDLLNQADNITRTVAGNSIIDSRSNQPTRIFSLGLAYNLSKFGGRNFRIN